MTLDQAIRIVVWVHTRDSNDPIPFIVNVGATTHNSAPWIPESDYVEAWGVLRKHLGLPT